MREVAGIIELSPSEVTRTNAGEREFSISQFERLSDHLKMDLWQLMLNAMREVDDKERLNLRVAKMAEELARDLKEIAKRESYSKAADLPKLQSPAAA
jgi:hypothetical protein